MLEGTLALVVEQGDGTGAGELIRVAPALRRQLVNRSSPGRTVLLVLGSAKEHQGRDGEAFASWEDEPGVPPQELPLPRDLETGEVRL